MLTLENIMEYLSKNHIQIISTSKDGQPISRPMGSAMLFKNTIWYCLNNDKPLFEQLQQNSKISICVCGSDFSWIRIQANAILIDDKEAKEAYIAKKIASFKDSSDPRFSVFYLENIWAELHQKGEKLYYQSQ